MRPTATRFGLRALKACRPFMATGMATQLCPTTLDRLARLHDGASDTPPDLGKLDWSRQTLRRDMDS
jgi:hypothetical protein